MHRELRCCGPAALAAALALAAVASTLWPEDPRVTDAKQSEKESGSRRSLRVIAHRGASGIAPENTLVALRLGMDAGAEAAEFDVHRTRDGELVLVHDHDLWRTTNCREVYPDRPREECKVSDFTLEEIRQLDAGRWKDARYAGERVPTLREALGLMRGRCVPVIEIKEAHIGEDVARLVESLDMADDVIAISFSPGAVADFRSVLPRSTIGLNRSKKDGDEERDTLTLCREHIAEARRIGANALIVDHRLVNREYLEHAHGRGMTVWVYTVDDPKRMEELIESGLDGLITNRPKVALELRDTGRTSEDPPSER